VHHITGASAEETSMILKFVVRTLFFTAVLAALLFVPAGTIHWRGAQILLVAMGGGGLIVGLWLARHDPALFKERGATPKLMKTSADRVLWVLLTVAYFPWLAFMALDVRWHGFAQMPAWLNVAGGVVIVLGFAAVIRIYRENSFASAVVRIQRERGHSVISTGPYAIVRHPMYSVSILTYFAIPFALGSWRGFLFIPLLIVLVVFRTLTEERVLKKQLEGYSDYMKKVRYRFVPYVW
jgi:protein-S-isoprenylcysteine O-methyltransferase Ste14